MNHKRRPAVKTLPLLAAGVLLLTGCSGSREDVRVTFCKNLTSSMLGSPKDLQWKGHEEKFRRPEYVAITLDLAHLGASGTTTSQSTCYFEYNAVEENAMTHSNPLTAYSSLPYRMTLNGSEIPSPELTEAVQAEQRRLGQAVVDSVKQAGQDAVRYVKDGLERAQQQ